MLRYLLDTNICIYVGLPEKANTKPSNKNLILIGLQAFR
jgi:hypothetical protein